MAPPALGDLPPYSADGATGDEPELVSLSQTHQGTKFGQGKPLLGQGNTLCKDFQWEEGQRASLLDIFRHILCFLHGIC